MELIGVILGVVIIFVALGILFSPPRKHKTFGYKDQQRSMRAFDRSETIDMGVPSGRRRSKSK